jgi:hypothetical protein
LEYQTAPAADSPRLDSRHLKLNSDKIGGEMRKIQDIILKLIAVMGICFFTALTIGAIGTGRKLAPFSETVSTVSDNWIKAVGIVLGCIVIIGIIWKYSSRVYIRHLRIAAAVIAILSAAGIITMALNAEYVPIADQEYVYVVLKNLFTGNYTELQKYWYYNVYPYQLGVGAVYLLPTRILGNYCVSTLQCIQAICGGIIIFTGNEIAWRLFHKERLCIFYLLFAICYAPLHLYELFIYGETIGVCFLQLAILSLLVLQEHEQWILWKKIFVYIAMISSMTVSYTAREALIIVWIAVLGIQFLRALKGNRKSFMISFFCVLLMILGQKTVIQCVEHQAELQLSEGVPAISVVAMGFQDEDPNHTGSGTYNAYEIHLFWENNFDVAKCKELSVLNIKQSIVRWMRDPIGALEFFCDKTAVQWLEPTYGSFLFTSNMTTSSKWMKAFYSDRGYQIFYEIMNQLQNVIYIGVLFYYIYLAKHKRQEKEYFLGLVLIGEVLFSLLWEAKSRYVFPYIVIALPAAAMGYWYLCNCIGKYLKTRT